MAQAPYAKQCKPSPSERRAEFARDRPGAGSGRGTRHQHFAGADTAAGGSRKSPCRSSKVLAIACAPGSITTITEGACSYADDPRFVLSTKAEHGACPEMITEALVARVGIIDTIVCHTDFDGLASAAKWIRNGVESYPGCDDDARAIDTRIGVPSRVADRFDRALRARPRDEGLFGLIVRHLATGLRDESLWQPVDRAAEDLIPIERDTRRCGRGAIGACHAGRRRFSTLRPWVYARVDKTCSCSCSGQEREAVPAWSSIATT